MSLRLLVIGDIAWDVLVRPVADFVWGADVYGSVDLLPGGSSANVAVWAHRLGAHVTLVGKVGHDRMGQLMRGHLEDEGVAERVAMVHGETTRIGVIVRPDGEHAFVTDHTHPLHVEATDLPLAMLDRTDVVFLNGYSVFMARSASFARPLFDEARRRDIPVAFDPSSASLIGVYGAARLLDELGALDVLLANEDEARALAPGQPAVSLLSRARLVVIKQGGLGATAIGATGTTTAPAESISAVDTTGAGDAFDAAFLVEYGQHGNLDVALAAANHLGARVASRLGAQTL
ncbi:MAG TPA: PfkB family carbohydrate kinase [Vicinamibacterales bacterium]|jgi:sugar/nucleoside kinase (ribokinase family)